ncbi:carboxypeptidase B-like [Vanessa cardui]|uniref:carboxypeptidase B-like n=1 Tax=Vanessa cardui TaxID=171605 RepID=UPI001F1403E6|nr:carboxypeptidase B-like [Vanessa cardui]
MDKTNRYNLRSLPGGRRGASGAGAGCYSMRSTGDEALSRRALVAKQATADHRELNSHSPLLVENVVQSTNVDESAPVKTIKRARKKWTKEMNMFILRTYYILTSLEEDTTSYLTDLHTKFLEQFPDMEDIKMEFGIDKCKINSIKAGRNHLMHYQLQTGETIDPLEENDTFEDNLSRYLVAVLVKMSILVVLLCGFAFSNAEPLGNNEAYSGYSVYSVNLRDRSDQLVLLNLQVELNVDLWDHGAPDLRNALVMVSPENKLKFLETLGENGINHQLHLADVAPFLKAYDEHVASWKQSRTNRMPFEDYPRYAEVDAYMERLAQEYPGLVTLVNAGPSFEGRAIKYLKISTTNFSNASKPIYFLDATLHAREWVTVPVALYSIHRLVENLRDQDRDLLENIDWIVLPIANPDGYEYSHTDDRLWRRTRSYNPEVSAECWGVDANRNFDVNFNTIGVSSNPCSNTYPGHVAFSEPEARYVRDILLENIDRLQLYMNIHSHGNYLLFGFGNGTLPANVAQLHHVAAAMGAAIDVNKLPIAPYYLIGNSNLVLYGTSGSAQDYGQEVGVPFSYTLELPGYGYNFVVPPQYINQINTETWEGIASSARLANLYYRARNSA